MKLEIMILTQPSRAKFLEQLLSILQPQLTPEVKLSIRMFDRKMPLGENREAMRRAATGDLISFIDDDDLVSGSYVSQILSARCDDVDRIRPTVERFLDWVPFDCGHLYSAPRQWHIFPTKRTVALLAPMSGGVGEDIRWANRMRRLHAIRSELVIGSAVYFYLCRTKKNDRIDHLHPERLKLLDLIRCGEV